MIKDILFALWFFLPAGIANATPIFMAKVPILRNYNAPIDFRLTYHGKRILGEHKTWRGLISGMLAATLVLWIQQIAVRHTGWAGTFTSDVNYAVLPTFILGPLFGFGALAGDAIESFFKRQRGTPPGEGWFPFDQTDYIIGGAIATAPFVHLRLMLYVILLLIWLLAHIVASYIGYLLNLKERPI